MSKLQSYIERITQEAFLSTENLPALEELQERLDQNNISLEQATGDLIDLASLDQAVTRLHGSLVSVESVSVTAEQVVDLQAQLTNVCELSGLGTEEILEDLSLEAVSPETVAKVKAFLKRIWEAIKVAAAKLWDFVKKAFKTLTDAEKQLYLQAIKLKAELKNMRDAITRSPTVPFTQDMAWATTKGEYPVSSRDLLTSLSTYQAVHSALHDRFAKRLEMTIKKVADAVNKLESSPTAETLNKAVIEANVALSMMAPVEVQKLFGSLVANVHGQPGVYLTYDRVLSLPTGKLPAADSPEFGDAIKQITIHVSQIEVPPLPEKAAMKAMQTNEIASVLDAVIKLLDVGTRSDSQKIFGPLERGSLYLQHTIETALETPSHETSSNLRAIMSASQLTSRWATLPFGKFDTVTVHYLRSVLKLCAAHIANYRSDAEDPAPPPVKKTEKEGVLEKVAKRILKED